MHNRQKPTDLKTGLAQVNRPAQTGTENDTSLIHSAAALLKLRNNPPGQLHSRQSHATHAIHQWGPTGATVLVRPARASTRQDMTVMSSQTVEQRKHSMHALQQQASNWRPNQATSGRQQLQACGARGYLGRRDQQLRQACNYREQARSKASSTRGCGHLRSWPPANVTEIPSGLTCVGT